MDKKIDVIILAGGKGTRLQSVVTDIPKPMAPIGDKPFLSVLINNLDKKHINKIVLSVGYKKEVIKQYFKDQYNDIPIEYAEENMPLGTGGAIWLSLRKCTQNTVLIINGDTFFDIDFPVVLKKFETIKPDVMICLKYLDHADRYGIVRMDAANTVLNFEEKSTASNGFINGGIYLINKSIVQRFSPPRVFSFEKDFLEKELENFTIKGEICDATFIDIGIPEDFNKAQTLLSDFV